MGERNMLDTIIEANEEEAYLKADGFDDAVIGVEEGTGRLIYSEKKCLEILMENDEMSMEDAIEHFEYNVKGSYVGKLTPIWCSDNFI